MEFSITTKPIDKLGSDLQISFLTEETVGPHEKQRDFSGKDDEVRLVFQDGPFVRRLLIGLGKRSKVNLEKLRERTSAAATGLKGLSVKTVLISLPKIPRATAEDVAQTITETLLLSRYEFKKYKTEQKDKTEIELVELATTKADRTRVKKGTRSGQIIAGAVSAVRDLGNHPGNVATPKHLAKHALDLARVNKYIKVKILEKNQIKKERMGAFLAVAQGSIEEPRFIILEYLPRKSAPTIALVGKGITFDSGGISIKPSEKMEEMKFDMAGGRYGPWDLPSGSTIKAPHKPHRLDCRH